MDKTAVQNMATEVVADIKLAIARQLAPRDERFARLEQRIAELEARVGLRSDSERAFG